MVPAGGGTESLVLDPQFADGALANQLALAILDRSDSLYQVPGYEARVHRWVPCWPPLGLHPSWCPWPSALSSSQLRSPLCPPAAGTATAGAIPGSARAPYRPLCPKSSMFSCPPLVLQACCP